MQSDKKRKKTSRRKKSISAHEMKPIHHYNTIGLILIIAVALILVLVIQYFRGL